MANKKVRVAIIGVGNCASSLVQGIQFYKDTADDGHVPGIMHTRLGGYHVRDIEFTLGIDVNVTKGRGSGFRNWANWNIVSRGR